MEEIVLAVTCEGFPVGRDESRARSQIVHQRRLRNERAAIGQRREARGVASAIGRIGREAGIQAVTRGLTVRRWQRLARIAAAHCVLPRLTVVVAADPTHHLVVRSADLHIEQVIAPGEIRTAALSLGLALFVLHVDASAVPHKVRRIVEIDVALDDRNAAIVRVSHRHAGGRRRIDQERRRLAMEIAGRVVGLHVEVQFVGDLPGHSGVRAPELDVFDEGAIFEESLRVREGAARDHAALGTVVAIDLHVDRDHGAIATDPAHVDAFEIVLLLAVHRIQEEVQIVGRAEFEAHDRVVAILRASGLHRTAETRDDCVVDLLNGESRVVGEQKVAIDSRAGRETVACIHWHGAWNRPVAAAGGVASGGIGAELRDAQIRIRPADRLEAGGPDLVVHAGHTDERAERTPGVAGDQCATRTLTVGLTVVHALHGVREVRSFAIEGTRHPHVHGTRRAAFDHVGSRGLVHRQLREQLRREQVEIDFAIGALGIGTARGCNRDRRAVQQHAREVRAQAANRDVQTFARHLTRDGDAGDAVEGFREVRIRKLADVLGENRIDEADRIALGRGGILETLAETCHDDFFQRAFRGRRRRLRERAGRQRGKECRREQRAAAAQRQVLRDCHCPIP